MQAWRFYSFARIRCLQRGPRGSSLQLSRQFGNTSWRSNSESPNHSSDSNIASDKVRRIDYNPEKHGYRLRVILTGGTSGIGFAVARKLVQENRVSYLLLFGRDQGRLNSTIAELRKSLHPNFHTVLLSHELSPLAQASEHKFEEEVAGVLKGSNVLWDTLINSAGVGQSHLLLRTDMPEMRELVSTNLTRSMIMSKAFIEHRKLRRFRDPANVIIAEGTTASIVSVSSLLGLQGGIGTTVYAASKAGLLGFTRALSAECGQIQKVTGGLVRVNAVVPGYVETAMTAGKYRVSVSSCYCSLDELLAAAFLSNLDCLLYCTNCLCPDFSKDFRDKQIARIPAGRFGKPEEVAEAIIFLIKNEYANNCILNLDGGLSASAMAGG